MNNYRTVYFKMVDYIVSIAEWNAVQHTFGTLSKESWCSIEHEIKIGSVKLKADLTKIDRSIVISLGR